MLNFILLMTHSRPSVHSCCMLAHTRLPCAKFLCIVGAPRGHAKLLCGSPTKQALATCESTLASKHALLLAQRNRREMRHPVPVTGTLSGAATHAHIVAHTVLQGSTVPTTPCRPAYPIAFDSGSDRLRNKLGSVHTTLFHHPDRQQQHVTETAASQPGRERKQRTGRPARLRETKHQEQPAAYVRVK
jgi:hypothetical protein